MVSTATFVSRTPLDLVLELLGSCGISLPGGAHPSTDATEVSQQITTLFSQRDQDLSARFPQCCERIAYMADEAGQNALSSVTQNVDAFEALPNAYARSCWVFLRESGSFRRAEEARYTDEHRRGRMWSGVLTKPGLSLRASEHAIDRFRQSILRELNSKNVHVDVFDRQRVTFDEKSFKIAQVTVFRDGLPEDQPEFENGKLGWRSRIPVYEAALTYEPESGTVEVVASNKKVRESLLRIFVKELLGDNSNYDALPVRRYDLSVLCRPFQFPTDAADGIESVSVRMLRLQPFDAPEERITFECSSPEPGRIWEMIADHLGRKNPLLVGFIITQAKLVIKFRPTGTSRRGKKLPVTIGMPHGCDLKERTEQERLVGEKYLRKWKLLADG
ncbi:hypothetical protein [Pseudorhodoplanes sp.]|uniref:hypothetical protein n=1 Tax=Pseudorhodoplanes sp. TaxID=1934341 RepID=UPI00391AE406